MITPFLRVGRAVYYVSFNHPGTGKKINRSLGVTEELAAQQIALDVERIFRNPAAWDITNPVLLTFSDAAVKAFHGCSAQVAPKSITIPAALVNAVAVAQRPVELVTENVAGSDDATMIANLTQQLIDRDIKIARLEESLRGWERRFNAHVLVKLGEAAAVWKKAYTHRAPSTEEDVVSRVEEFVEFVGPKLKLGDLTGGHVDAWLETYKVERPSGRKKDGVEVLLAALEPRSLRRRKGCISVFVSWCVRKYQMYGNPIVHVQPIAGLPAEHIEAIRRLEELNGLLDTLTGYWRAFAGVACLGGLRLAEMFWLKRDDVYFREGYMRVTSRTAGPGRKGKTPTKTGKERNVPIERTKLKTILEDYFASNGAGSWRAEWPWMFPTLAETPAWVKDRKTPAGLWCNGNNFRDWLEVNLDQAKLVGPDELLKRDFWNYGPREWRHTAGTAMGMSGLSALAISKVLGNTPEVCERHYIGVRAEDAGLRWPFIW